MRGAAPDLRGPCASGPCNAPGRLLYTGAEEPHRPWASSTPDPAPASTRSPTGIYRISTPVPPSAIPGGFTFNQFLIVDDAPLLFHTGPRRMFPLVREAVAHVLGDAARLR